MEHAKLCLASTRPLTCCSTPILDMHAGAHITPTHPPMLQQSQASESHRQLPGPTRKFLAPNACPASVSMPAAPPACTVPGWAGPQLHA